MLISLVWEFERLSFVLMLLVSIQIPDLFPQPSPMDYDFDEEQQVPSAFLTSISFNFSTQKDIVSTFY